MGAPAGQQLDDRVAAVVAEVERTGWAAQLTSPDWKLLWVSSELKRLLGTEDDEELGCGRHVMEAYSREMWSSAVTLETQMEQFALEVPMMLSATPGGKDEIKGMIREDIAEAAATALEDMEPRTPPPVWVSTVDFLQGDLPAAEVNVINIRVSDDDGEPLGILRFYGSALPASLLNLVGRGDQEMFERMARLLQPGRQQAAILFADIQASGALARRMSSAAFFSLIRDLTTAIDDVVLRHKGLVGKHAGDGVTAFFLENDLGSVSAAARAAIESAREIVAVPETTADLPTDAECLFNVGVHWGATLYMGQVVTGGRIEVTALGDEVNEGARVQQVARDGQVLASKQLIERLAGEDAAALSLPLEELTYTPLAEMEGAGEKAVRDAGGVAVTDIRTGERAQAR